MPIVVAVSGGFDPIHIGHIRMIQDAAKLGDELVVIVNNDCWLIKKKGFVFMPEEERVEIIRAIAGVSRVVLTEHPADPEDMSVAETLRHIRPDIFCNGGDRHAENTPEDVVCGELGIKMVFNVGEGGKIQSSSELVRKIGNKERKV